MNKEGSCLLTILLLCTLISFFCLHLWNTTVLMFETTLAKQQFQQDFHLVQGLLTYAIDISKNNFDSLLEYSTLHPTGLPLKIPCLKINNSTYSGTIIYTAQLKNNNYFIHIDTELYCHKLARMHLSCNLHKEIDAVEATNQYRISTWHLENKT